MQGTWHRSSEGAPMPGWPGNACWRECKTGRQEGGVGSPGCIREEKGHAGGPATSTSLPLWLEGSHLLQGGRSGGNVLDQPQELGLPISVCCKASTCCRPQSGERSGAPRRLGGASALCTVGTAPGAQPACKARLGLLVQDCTLHPHRHFLGLQNCFGKETVHCGCTQSCSPWPSAMSGPGNVSGRRVSCGVSSRDSPRGDGEGAGRRLLLLGMARGPRSHQPQDH